MSRYSRQLTFLLAASVLYSGCDESSASDNDTNGKNDNPDFVAGEGFRVCVVRTYLNKFHGCYFKEGKPICQLAKPLWKTDSKFLESLFDQRDNNLDRRVANVDINWKASPNYSVEEWKQDYLKFIFTAQGSQAEVGPLFILHNSEKLQSGNYGVDSVVFEDFAHADPQPQFKFPVVGTPSTPSKALASIFAQETKNLISQAAANTYFGTYTEALLPPPELKIPAEYLSTNTMPTLEWANRSLTVEAFELLQKAPNSAGVVFDVMLTSDGRLFLKSATKLSLANAEALVPVGIKGIQIIEISKDGAAKILTGRAISNAIKEIFTPSTTKLIGELFTHPQGWFWMNPGRALPTGTVFTQAAVTEAITAFGVKNPPRIRVGTVGSAGILFLVTEVLSSILGYYLVQGTYAHVHEVEAFKLDESGDFKGSDEVHIAGYPRSTLAQNAKGKVYPASLTRARMWLNECVLDSDIWRNKPDTTYQNPLQPLDDRSKL